MARNAHRFAPHAHVLYAAFIGNDKRHDIGRTARLMGIGASTLYGYCENDESMPIDLVAPLYAATRDARLISDLLGLGDVGLTVSVDPVESSPDTVRNHALKLGAAVGTAQSTVLKALEDDDVNDVEAKAIAQAVEEVQRQGETLCKASKLKVAK